VLAASEPPRRSLLEGEQAQLLEPSSLGSDEGPTVDIGVGPPTPLAERLIHHADGRLAVAGERFDPRSCGGVLEATGVDLLRLELEGVAALPMDQHGRSGRPEGRVEDPTDVAHVHPQRRCGTARWATEPQVVHEPVRRHDLVARDDEAREEREPQGPLTDAVVPAGDTSSSGPSTRTAIPEPPGRDTR
jgi:hypothetical protein